MVITIDGLSANGKTTLASRLAACLGFKSFSAGAIYRALTLEIINKNLDTNNIPLLIEQLKNINLDFEEDKVYLNGEEVSQKLRTDEITLYSTIWGLIPEIKELVRSVQKNYANKNNVIMEGRDIASRVVPDAEIKFYLYADFSTRVKRFSIVKNISEEAAAQKLQEIDKLDMQGNFVKPTAAYEIDTTNLTLDEVIGIMLKIVEENRNIRLI